MTHQLPRPRRAVAISRTLVSRSAAAIAVASLLALAGCESAAEQQQASGEPAPVSSTWRADCAPFDGPPPLSLEAARQAHRLAERRQALRVREAADPGWFVREMTALLDPERMAAGQICPADLIDRGQMVFEHEYGFRDGLGSGAAAKSPRGPFRRVHGGEFGGPETISCLSCHWVGGPNGAGAETDNAILNGDGMRVASGDARNPPALVALGVVEALAREMSRALQRQRDDLVGDANRAGTARETPLSAKGVEFGVLRVSATGEIDATGIRGVDPDLVVKPFGWKGILSRIESFSTEALQVHLGVQNEELIASGSPGIRGAGEDPTDPDGDGMRHELGRGPFTAMVAHLALLEMPTVDVLIQDRALPPAAAALLPPSTTSFVDDFERGRKHFHELGCASCHVPMMVLDSPMLTLDGLPSIDLAREMRPPRLSYDASVNGYPVWLFSDLKRHDMGEANAAQHVQRGVARREYLTPRLWGVADSAPYLHDGRAPSFDYAIAGHDGEGAQARAAYAALDMHEKGALRVYLMSLRRSPRLMVP